MPGPRAKSSRGADSRQTDSFDPLEKLEAADKSLQERGEFLIFFLPHGLQIEVILSLKRGLVYPIPRIAHDG